MSGNHRNGGRREPADGYRAGGPSGGYPAGGSGPYRGGSGSHRIVHSRPPRRRLAALVAGVLAGAAVCAAAIFVMLGVAGDDGTSGGLSTTGTTAGDTTGGGGAERSIVPDACQMISDGLADELAPNADRTQSATYKSSDRENQCVWGVYVGNRKRVLTVELRAVVGSGAATGARQAGLQYREERKDDQSGKSLLGTQRLAAERSVPDLGDEAYAIYALDTGQDNGEAIVNARVGNVLVTVHYSGFDKNTALGEDPAIDGAVAAAKEVVATLSTSK